MPLGVLILALLCQATQPVGPTMTDPTVDWLLEQSPTTQPAGDQPATTQPATTQPATTQPATTDAATTRPAPPFVDKAQPGEAQGTIELSDGTSVAGIVASTPGKPLRLWSEEQKRYYDVSLDSIASMEAVVLWERDQPEWRFKESGFDEKVYTGLTYPARETQYRVTLANGEQLVGGVVAPIYVRVDGQTRQFVLNKRSKGEVGKTLAELVYVKRLTLR